MLRDRDRRRDALLLQETAEKPRGVAWSSDDQNYLSLRLPPVHDSKVLIYTDKTKAIAKKITEQKQGQGQGQGHR